MIEKEEGECFPYLFICPKCKGFNDCEYSEDGLCLCPWCDEDKIEKYEKDQMNINCLKCNAWDMAAKENGYDYGMCKECFDKSFVSFKSEWEG